MPGDLCVSRPQATCIRLRIHFAMDVLPRDVFLLVSRFLTGFELLALSHVNRRVFLDLLAPNGVAWRSRMACKSFSSSDAWQGSHGAVAASKSRWKTKYKRLLGDLKHVIKAKRTPSTEQLRPDKSYKALYFTSMSLRFSVSHKGGHRDRRVGSAVPLGDAVRLAWNEDAFSFDLWFARLPAASSGASTNTSAVLLGAQTSEWPRLDLKDGYSQQFVSVDHHGNLFCSMTVDNPVVAAHLKYERWYHVALSFRRSPGDWRQGLQCVYLDGDLIHTSEGTVHPKWRFLNFAQVGSGCISSAQIDGDNNTRSAVSDTRWSGFNGVVDDCRFWSQALTASQVQSLQQGEEDQVTEAGAACVWALKEESEAIFYGSSYAFVRCTRPRERRFAVP